MLVWQFSGPAPTEHCADRCVSHGPFQTCDRLLTSIIVVEEGIQPGSIDEYVLRVQNAQAPCFSAVAGLTIARTAKVGIVECSIDGKRSWRWRAGLIVWSLGLHEAREDVLGVRELVLVHDVVLNGGSVPVIVSLRPAQREPITYSHIFPAVLSINKPRPA